MLHGWRNLSLQQRRLLAVSSFLWACAHGQRSCPRNQWQITASEGKTSWDLGEKWECTLLLQSGEIWGTESSVEGTERVLPSSHTHTSRTETFPLPESRDPLGEKGHYSLFAAKAVHFPSGLCRLMLADSWAHYFESHLTSLWVTQPCIAALQLWRGSWSHQRWWGSRGAPGSPCELSSAR